MKKQKEPNKLNEFLENERFKDEKKSWVKQQQEKALANGKKLHDEMIENALFPGTFVHKPITDGRGLMAQIPPVENVWSSKTDIKGILEAFMRQPIEPRQQMLNAWLLIAYPDDIFLSVFKSKKDDGIVYIGGSEVMHQIHKRLYELDQKLYIELYGMEAGEKIDDIISNAIIEFHKDLDKPITVFSDALKRKKDKEFDEMSNLFVSEPKKDEVDMEPYNALTKAKLEKILKPIFKHKSKK